MIAYCEAKAPEGSLAYGLPILLGWPNRNRPLDLVTGADPICCLLALGVRKFRMRIARFFAIAFMAIVPFSESCAAPAAAPPAQVDAGEVVIRAFPPHCRPAAGDPQDEVDLSPAASGSTQQVIRLDPASGKYILTADDYPTTAPGVWQRDGVRLHEFVFRVPTDGNPLCIGTRSSRSLGMAQLRQAIDAKPYRHKILRFTAWVATRQVNAVKFWLVAGTNDRPKFFNIVASSGNWKEPITGSKAWFPVSLTIGPLPCNADQVSFGMTLDGRGDAWMFRPRLEEVDRHGMAADEKKQLEKRPVAMRAPDGGPPCGLLD